MPKFGGLIDDPSTESEIQQKKPAEEEISTSPHGEISISPSTPPDEEVLIFSAASSLLDEYTKSGNYKMSGSEKRRFDNALFTLQQDHFPKTHGIELLRTMIVLSLEDWERNAEESRVYKVLQKKYPRSL